MKFSAVLFTLFMSMNLLAHEGHGEAPKDPSRFGGQLSNVVDATKVSKKEKNNPPIFKSELIRSEDGTLRLYIFDLKMKDTDLSSFSSKIEANVENTKNKINLNFELEKHGNHFMGKMPKVNKRPFNLYFKIKNKNQDLFVGYDNLD